MYCLGLQLTASVLFSVIVYIQCFQSQLICLKPTMCSQVSGREPSGSLRVKYWDKNNADKQSDVFTVKTLITGMKIREAVVL